MKIDPEYAEKRIEGKSITQSLRKEQFSKLLNEEAHKGGNSPQTSRLVHLGTISDIAPTVSNLLIGHPMYRKDIWKIIHSELNQDRPFTEIRPGTDIYLDPETLEILWKRDGFQFQTEKRPEPELSLTPPDAEAKDDGKPEKTRELIALGVISRSNPTVSHLLKNQSDYRQTAYRIIHSEINLGKPYTRMVEGTMVFLDPETLELVWDRQKNKQNTPPTAQYEKQFVPEVQPGISEKGDFFSENLIQSIEDFMGSPYEEIDCFELLVRGLNKMGVAYSGQGGLHDRLVKMAVDKGLPKNAYLNGEGLVEASGTQVYSKSLPRIHHADVQADRIYEEMEPFLNKGFILSFSTHTRGHTGIVSQKNQQWTYINSGTMDHHLGGSDDSTGDDRKGVGEEVLADEIKNWVRLAAERRESLKITLGRLNAQKLFGTET
jgi:hypothetical protein